MANKHPLTRYINAVVGAQKMIDMAGSFRLTAANLREFKFAAALVEDVPLSFSNIIVSLQNALEEKSNCRFGDEELAKIRSIESAFTLNPRKLFNDDDKASYLSSLMLYAYAIFPRPYKASNLGQREITVHKNYFHVWCPITYYQPGNEIPVEAAFICEFSRDDLKLVTCSVLRIKSGRFGPDVPYENLEQVLGMPIEGYAKVNEHRDELLQELDLSVVPSM